MDKQPKTLQEAMIHFADKQNAHDFVVSLRWEDGVTCPHCGGKEQWFIKTRLVWRCKACKKQFSVKVGTIFEDSPLGLDKWLCAIWMIANAKNGISSYEIHRALGITQKTAWFVLHRIRLYGRKTDMSEEFEKFKKAVKVIVNVPKPKKRKTNGG